MKMKIKNLALSFAAIFLLTGCNNNNNGGNTSGTSGGNNGESSEHTHTFSSEWKHDDENHWHESTCGHDVKGSQGAHIFDEGVITEPTYEKEGYTTYTCSVCGYSYKDKETEMLKHNYSSEWSSDDTSHWHVCTDEGYEDLKIDFAYHSWNLTKTVEATFDEDGYYEYTCLVCDRTKKETINKKEHSYSSSWSADYDYHWRACSDKGYTTDPSLVKDKSKHSFDSDGTCSVCEFSNSVNNFHFSETYADTNVPGYSTYYMIGKITKNCANVIIPKEYNGGLVIRIGVRAFEDGRSLQNVVIPDSIVSMGLDCFKGCTNLKSVFIPSSVNSIVDNPFYGCTNIESIVVDENNAYYDSRNNCNCLIRTETNTLKTGCKNSFIPTDVTEIDDYAFANIWLTEGITLPDGLVTIGDEAFISSFYDNGSYIDKFNLVIPNTVKYIGKKAFAYAGLVKSLTLSNSLEKIGDEAFSGFYTITSLTIPSSVSSIGNCAFSYCNKLTSVVVDENNTKYDSRNECNAIIETATDTLIIGFNISTIPDTVKVIGDYAFSSFSGEAINIPQGVVSIGKCAFHSSKLKNVTLPNTITEIGSSAFYHCSNLTSLTIESGATSSTSSSWAIGDYAFYWLSSLTSVKLGDNIKSIGGSAFAYCKALKDVTLPKSLTSIGELAFKLCTSLESINLPTSLESIGKSAFSECSALTAITIPDSVTSINTSAFSGCTLLKTVTLSKNLTLIASSLFEKCSSLESIVIPDNVISINAYAFSNCENLSSISIPSSVTSVSYYAFLGCSSLETISLPGVTTISSDAFRNCSKLSSITLSDNLTEINSNVFANCTALKYLVVPTSVTKIGSGVFLNCTAFEHFFYKGTNVEFKNVKVDQNSKLEDSKIYYYSETEPTESGNYWHYVDDVPTVWAAQ